MDRLRFQSLASGSSGNCYFIGNASYGFLIDAGIGVRTIRKCLRNIGLDFRNIWGVFVTHDHADHIKAVGALGERYKVPVYATRMTHEGIKRSYCVTEKLYESKRFIEKFETIELGDFKVTAFHDRTMLLIMLGIQWNIREKDLLLLPISDMFASMQPLICKRLILWFLKPITIGRCWTVVLIRLI